MLNGEHILRDYQIEAVKANLETLQRHRSTMNLVATGCVSGGTIVPFAVLGKENSLTISELFKRSPDDEQIAVRSAVSNRLDWNYAKSVVFSGNKRTLVLTLENGFSIRATPDHEILTERGFVALIVLLARDIVMCDVNGYLCSSAVKSIIPFGVEPTYDIVCEDPHRNFVANGIVVHNCGKTQIGLATVANYGGTGVLWLAHREELITQPYERWHSMFGDYGDIVQAEKTRSRNRLKSRITFGSVQTLYREERLKHEFPDKKEIGLIVTDECHHCISDNKTYSNIINYFMDGNQDCKHIGMTATSDRTDEQALAQSYESVAYEYPLFDPNGGPSGIGDGWLVPLESETIVIDDLQLDAVGIQGGDFIGAQLEQEMLKERPLHRISEATWDIAAGRPTIVFTAGVEQSVRMSEIFCRKKSGSSYAIVSRVPDDGREYPWCIQSGDKERRKWLFKNFGLDGFTLLSNCAVATEGTDLPLAAVCSQGRPTKSRALSTQQVGRVTRVLPGIIEGQNSDGSWWRLMSPEDRKQAITESKKPFATVIDFVGNTRHSLISPRDILGGNMPDEVVARAKENAEQGKGSKNVLESLKEAEEELEFERQQRERMRLMADANSRKLIEAKVAYTRQKVDVFNVLHVHQVREPVWHRGRKPTQKMIDCMTNFGVDQKDISQMSFVQSASAITKIRERREKNLCTFKQAKTLAKFNIDPDNVKFDQARSLLDKIAGNKWKPLPIADVMSVLGVKS